MSPQQIEELRYDWRCWGRPDQQTPAGNWAYWLILAGRFWGKTKTGAEWIRAEVESGRAGRIAFIAETAADARDVMVEGVSGILSVGPPYKCPVYEPSKRRLTWPNGAMALLFNGTEPDQLRGPAFDLAWCDELAKYTYAQETWDQLQFGLRMGINPRVCITTTPRPIKIIKDIAADRATHMTRGRSVDNADNISAGVMARIVGRYAGTRLGRQELDAEILEDVPGALWTLTMFEAPGFRVDRAPDMARVVVAVDPSGARGADDEGADSIGIIVAGKGVDGRGYVLADRTCRLSPDGWGRRAVTAYHEFGADRIIAERNFGGAMVEHVIRSIDPNVAYSEVTASRGKIVRAEPVAAMYEQGRISHVGPYQDFDLLEAQLCQMGSSGYIGEGSPDRVDACAWAITDLMGGSGPGPEDYLPYLRAQIAGPVGLVPALPWHGQAAEEKVDDGGLMAAYERAFAGLAERPPVCKRCGKPIGASRITDGIDVWHRPGECG